MKIPENEQIHPITAIRLAEQLVIADNALIAARQAIIRAMQMHGVTPQVRRRLDSLNAMLWADEIEVKTTGNGKAFDFGQILIDSLQK